MSIKPMILANDDFAEGVYAAASGGGCYTTTWTMDQRPEEGRVYYVIGINGVHHADHTKTAQRLHISFNQAVEYVSCNANGAQYVSGNNSEFLEINLGYYQNPSDNIKFDDLIVVSNPGLTIKGCSITD